MKNLFSFFILTLLSLHIYAVDNEDESVDALKIEANHNIERLKSFKNEDAANKIFENEREKGLGEYFEEQEKWDLIRERGLQDYRREKRKSSISDKVEDYQQDLKDKAVQKKEYEKSRQMHVKARDKVRNQQSKTISQLEDEELKVYLDRPRYEVRKRKRNKWVASGTTKPSPGINAPGFQGSSPNDFVPPPPSEFPPAPAPYEGFEELPPPPAFDGNMNSGVPYDPSFGGEMSIPPPPPPPPDYDF